MVQLSSPKSDRFPINSGDNKERTVNRVGQSEKSEFSRTLEQQKTAGKEQKTAEKKNDPQGSSNHSKTEQAKSSQQESSHTKELAAKSVKLAEGRGQESIRVVLAEDLKSIHSEEDHPAPGKKKADRKKGILSRDSSESLVQGILQQISEAGMKKVANQQTAGLSEKAGIATAADDTGHSPTEMPMDSRAVKELVSSGRGAETADAVNSGAVAQTLTPDSEGKEQAGRKKTSLHRNAVNRSAADKVISVEDRRSVKTEEAKAVFSPAKEQNEEGLTLEMAPREEMDGAAAGIEVRNTQVQFSLDTAEEQKGSFLLNKQLQEGGTKDLAKNIRFVLKDRNQGEIKLILKPEALGKVRIQLNLQENNIVGKIFVENNNVKQVFLNNLPDLTKALEESGFQTTSLDVQVGGGETGSHDRHHQERPVFFQREATDLEESIPVVFDGVSSLSQINLVV